MPSILESVASVLGQGDTFAKLGSLIGGDAKQAETAVETAGPALLGGLSETASAPGGPAALASMLDEVDTSILDDPAAYVAGIDEAGDEADTSAGESILDGIFGGDRGALLDGLASRSGLGAGMFGKLLPVLAPLFMGVVARLRDDDGLDADGLAALVGEERDGLETDGKLGDWFSNLFAGGGALAAVAGLGALAKDKVGDLADDVEDALDDLKDRLTGDDDDDDDGDEADGDGDDDGDEADDDADGDGDDDDDDDDGKVALAATAAAGAVAAGGAKVVADGRDKAGAATTTLSAGRETAAAAAKGGLPGWIRWAVGAAIVVALLALALSQCGSDDDAGVITGTETTETTVAGGGADDTATDDTAADDTATDDTAEEAAGPTTTVDDSATTEADSATTAAATPTTASTTATTVDVNAAVQAALKAADLGTGIVATYADGVVTLTGTVETEEAKEAAATAVGAVDGVTNVVNEVVVPAAGGTGSSINDTLDLAPITFRYLSARITPEGEQVLAEVVTYLNANPGNVEIQGHTDSDGSEAKNLVLSQARADSVKAYLVAAGIDGARLTTVGLGEASPKVPNDSLENKAINRRIEFVLK